MPVTPYPYGDKPAINTRLRRCKMCGKRLNSYNLNKYCHAHSLKGSMMEMRDMEFARAKRAKEYARKKGLVKKK